MPISFYLISEVRPRKVMKSKYNIDGCKFYKENIFRLDKSTKLKQIYEEELIYCLLLGQWRPEDSAILGPLN
jgi:hypothetical protein